MELDAATLIAIVEHAGDIIVVTEAGPLDEPGPRIVYVNPAFTELTGYRPEGVVGLSPRILQGPGTDPKTCAEIRAALQAGEPCHVTILNYGKGGRAYWLDMKIVPLRDAEGRFTRFAAIERDVTESVIREQTLAREALTDPLTGLANRRAFQDSAERAWAGAVRRGEPVSLALLDIDHFKQINDRHGHHSGDVVLRSLAATASSCVRGGDLLARIGGEEFAVLMPDADEASAAEAMERLRRSLETQSALVDGGSIAFTVSIGVTTAVAEGGATEGIATLLKTADHALYAAKGAGRNQIMAV